MDSIKLIVEFRPSGGHQGRGDYKCFLENDSRYWDCGKTPNETIGMWMKTHGKDFGIIIEERK